MSTNDQIILDQVLQQKRQELAPTLSPSAFFEVFVAEQALKDFDLSYEELEAGVVGEGGDGGIDAIYVFANGELVQDDFEFESLKKGVILDVVIVQAKLTAGFGEAAIDRLIAVTEDLFNLASKLEEFNAIYNESLRSAVNGFRRVYEGLAARFPSLRFRFVYATRGIEVHPNVRRKSDNLITKVRGLYSAAETCFDFLGASDLLGLARRAPRTSYTLPLAESPISSSGDIGFICLVRLKDYHEFITDEQHRLRKGLFEANVRDYQGQTQVNDEIQKSLRNQAGEDFWWLNNGITIVASNATQSGKALALEDPQIVNGLQTSTEIHNYFNTGNTVGDQRTLLVRVIVPTAGESRDRIIKATNSQTYIPPASLRATDKIQRDIEEYLRPFSLYYDRRKNSYKNDGKPLDRIVSISLMAQAVMAIVLQRPDTARARPSSLLKSDQDYDRLFSSEYDIKLYRICMTILKRVEGQLRADATLTPKDRNNIRFYAAMHYAAILTGKTAPTVRELCTVETDSISAEGMAGSQRAVNESYQALGATDQVAKGTSLLEAIREDLRNRLGTPAPPNV